MTKRGQLLVVGLVMLVALLDCGQSQDGLRFPNLFGGLTNFFRQATQQQPQPQQRPVNSQVSPGSGVGTTFPFLQAPPPAFQQPPQQQQQQQAPVFFQNTGGVQSLPFQQPQPVAGAFTPSIPFQPQQQQPPWPFATANSNAQVPTLLPIGNIPLQNTPTRPAPLAPIPAQFALSENTLQQQQQSVRQGKSILNKPDLLLSASTKDVIDCGAGNDLGFCAISEKYPRQAVEETMHQCHDVVRQMYAEVPEDYDALGDSHRRADTIDAIVSQQQQPATTTSTKRSPWSWSTYRKESACDSELRFITPQVAQDRNGRWRVIVQTDDFPQRVAIDVCRNVDGTCKVLTDCGRKSRCVQRYSFQPLISLDPQTAADEHQVHPCPSMAVFRFPTSCVCHVEVDKPTQRLGQ